RLPRGDRARAEERDEAPGGDVVSPVDERVGGSPLDRVVAGRTAYILLHNTSEVVTPDPEGRRVVRYPKGAVVFRDARVLEVGSASDLLKRHGEARPVNAGGRLVTPGLV